ncbi:MAG: response regulator transcription factor [Clostridia bacterium]|nr:response regulator transcription factor [Clostridia bacterium]
MIRTVIVEDNLIIQKFLSDLLAGDGRFEVVAMYRDAFEAETFCLNAGIDLVLMDVQTLHNHNGLSVGERLKKRGSKAKIVALTSLVDPAILKRAKNGASDSLWYKDHGSADLVGVIDRTLAGEHVFPESPPNVELKGMLSAELTDRQLDVLRCFVRGLTYDETAEKLYLSRIGVRKIIERVKRTGGFENKWELMAVLLESKLIVTSLLDKEQE